MHRVDVPRPSSVRIGVRLALLASLLAAVAILAGLVLAAGAYLVRMHARRAVPEGGPAS